MMLTLLKISYCQCFSSDTDILVVLMLKAFYCTSDKDNNAVL
jgi:hypothetical protein